MRRAPPVDHPRVARVQIVHYEPGQFYKAHHDQNSALWVPQGPRVLTFFMYLREPASGGETDFPTLKIKVPPVRGSAILWPSVRDDQPMESDARTTHAALAPTEGIKVGANTWLHQFDFKSPSERGCPLTYVNSMGNKPRTAEHRELVEGYVPDAEQTRKHAGMP